MFGVSVSDSALASHFTQSELRRFKSQFDGASPAAGSPLTSSDIVSSSLKLGFHSTLSDADAAKVIADYDTEGLGSLSFEGFLRLQADLDTGNSYFSPLSKPRNNASKDFIRSPIYSTVHVINQSEKKAYVEHINSCSLKEDEQLKDLLPISAEGDDLMSKVKSGVLLCKLVNLASPGTIDERVINIKARLNQWEQNENHTLALNSARAIGCQVVNISSIDLSEGREHLVLGLIAQIIKAQLMSMVKADVSAALVKELAEEAGEEVKNDSSEQLLLRWMNHHLKKANYSKEVANFSSDIKDGEAYTLLLHQLAPEKCDLSPLSCSGLERANRVLQQADRIGCCKYLQAQDMVDGLQNLNLAFVAHLFHTMTKAAEADKENEGAKAVEQEEELKPAELDMSDVDMSVSDEERMYRLWINSVGIATPVTNVFRDVSDGKVLLEILDRLQPGCVNWKAVSKPSSMKSKGIYSRLENCQLAVKIASQALRINLVGIGGADIANGNRMLILSSLWQLMRFHMFSLLQRLRKSQDKDKELSDEDILVWANEKVEKAGRTSKMESFKDRSLSSGIFFLDLLAAVQPRVVDWNIVTKGTTDEEKLQNANYIISVGRKLGCSIFLVPYDLVKVRPRMTFMLTASIMAFDFNVAQGGYVPNSPISFITPTRPGAKSPLGEVNIAPLPMKSLGKVE